MRRTTFSRPSGAVPAPSDSMRLPAMTTYPLAYSVSSASTVAIEQFSMTMRWAAAMMSSFSLNGLCGEGTAGPWKF